MEPQLAKDFEFEMQDAAKRAASPIERDAGWPKRKSVCMGEGRKRAKEGETHARQFTEFA